MRKTELFFPYEPKSKGRPRFTRTGHTYTPQITRDYEKQIGDFYKENTSDYYDSPIKVSLVFYMPIPKSTSKKKMELMKSGAIRHTKKPDSDNLAKAVLDGINGVAFEDDKLITELRIKKRYGSVVGTAMVITEDVD